MRHRSPLRTHAVAPLVSARLLRRVMITSPRLARLPSARTASRSSLAPSRRIVRAARLSSATWLRVGASMIASSPAEVSAFHAATTAAVAVSGSTTCTRSLSR